MSAIIIQVIIDLPVCTLSPIFSSAIITDFPFSRKTVAVDGKHDGEHPQQTALLLLLQTPQPQPQGLHLFWPFTTVFVPQWQSSQHN